jgi:methyl-accepting chemotaxis protein
MALGFGLLIAITAMLGAFVQRQVAAIGQSAQTITHTSMPAIEHMGQIESYVRQNMLHTLRHVLTQDPGQLAAIEDEMKLVTAANDKAYAAYQATLDPSRDKERFDALVAARQEYLALRRELLAISREETDGTQRSMEFYRTRVIPAMDVYIRRIRDSVRANKLQSESSAVAIGDAIGATSGAVLAGILASLLAGGVLAYVIVGSVTRVLRHSVSQLGTGAGQVASAAQHVAASARSLSEGATDQATSIEETSASMEQVASMTRRNAETGSQAARTMAETERLVQDANRAFAGMVASMDGIKAASQKVSRIIKTIDELAFQTNVLALNAAVEAARAGEAGMGFAVVADEVRSLAQRSAQAARDTADLIAESLSTAEEGHQRVADVTTAMDAITGSAARVKALIDDVSAASQQQTQGIDRVSGILAQMAAVTQRTAASAEESSAASEQLATQADSMIEVVDLLAMLCQRQGRSLAAVRADGRERHLLVG